MNAQLEYFSVLSAKCSVFTVFFWLQTCSEVPRPVLGWAANAFLPAAIAVGPDDSRTKKAGSRPMLWGREGPDQVLGLPSPQRPASVAAAPLHSTGATKREVETKEGDCREQQSISCNCNNVGLVFALCFLSLHKSQQSKSWRVNEPPSSRAATTGATRARR